jgi:hypothetical protein
MLDALTKPTKPLDYRAINARACKHWQFVYSHLVDLHGRILEASLARLNPTVAAELKDRKERPRRKLEHFRINDQSAGGLILVMARRANQSSSLCKCWRMTATNTSPPSGWTI